MRNFKTELIATLKILTSDAKRQISWLTQIGVEGAVDELALNHDDVAVLAKDKFDQGEINQMQFDKLMALDKKLDDMSGQENAALWTEEALKNSDEWKEVRQLAKECLQELNP